MFGREDPGAPRPSARSLLVVAHDWPPSAKVGAVRPAKLVKFLSAHGWNATVVTVQEHYYVARSAAPSSGPGGARVVRTRCVPNPRDLYQAVKQWLFTLTGREQRFRQAVLRWADRAGAAATPPSLGGRLKRLVLSLLYTPDECLGWAPFGVAGALRATRRRRAHCMVSTGPPFTAHLVGLAVKRVRRIPWVAELRDPWSRDEIKPDGLKSPWAERITRWLEARVVRRADRVVCVTPEMTEFYRKTYPDAPPEKWVTITNGFDPDDFPPGDGSRRARRFSIVHVGALYAHRSPEALFRALGGLLGRGAMDRREVAVRLIGWSRYAEGRSVAEAIAEHGLADVAEIVDLLPRPQAIREMTRAHVLLLLAVRQKLQVPGKAYEYLAAGGHILAFTEEDSATAAFVHRTGRGVVVSEQDIAGIQEALLTWYRRFKEEGPDLDAESDPSLAQAAYGWRTLGAQYATLLDELCAG